MFLLTIDYRDMRESKSLPTLPEFTLWQSFGEAAHAAFDAAAKCGVIIDMSEADIDIPNGQLVLPEFCEILPISISTTNKITWLGKERKSNEG